jgi:hypothetical protein
MYKYHWLLDKLKGKVTSMPYQPYKDGQSSKDSIGIVIFGKHFSLKKTLPPDGDVIVGVPKIGAADILFRLREPADPWLCVPRTLPALDDTCKNVLW